MRRKVVAALLALLAAGGLSTGIASAHANWLHGNIKNNEVFTYGHTPKEIRAYFAEDLDPNHNRTWMAVFEGVADHGLVTEHTKSAVNFKNPKEMTLKLPAKLPRDKYYIIWYTHSATDGHYAAGIIYFRVK